MLFSGSRSPAFPGQHGIHIPKGCAAHTAHDVHEVRHIIVRKDDIIHLLAQIQCRHQQHGHRDAAGEARQRCQHDEHEHDARSPQQGSMGEEHTLQNTRDERREQDALEQGATAIFFFHRRADDQQQEHIVQEMIPAGMAQHMAEEPDVKQWVFQRTAIDAEQVLCGPAACPLPQEQSPQGEQKKGQDHRRIVLQLQCKLGTFRKRFILSTPALARTEFKDIIAFMPDTGQAGHPPFCSAWERACARHVRGRPPAPAGAGQSGRPAGSSGSR